MALLTRAFRKIGHRHDADSRPKGMESSASRRVVPRQPCSLDQTPKYTFPLLFDRFIARAQSGGYVTPLQFLCAQSSRKQERQEGRWNRAENIPRRDDRTRTHVFPVSRWRIKRSWLGFWSAEASAAPESYFDVFA